MRSLLIGVAVLALVAPAAQAQQGTGGAAADAVSGRAEAGGTWCSSSSTGRP